MLSIIIDPAKLVDGAFHNEELAATLDYVKSSRPINEEEPVILPGELERLTKVTAPSSPSMSRLGMVSLPLPANEGNSTLLSKHRQSLPLPASLCVGLCFSVGRAY